jgi:membrane protein DedA with SNARE-associated domain
MILSCSNCRLSGKSGKHASLAPSHTEKKKWPERLFKRYGAKVVFITRFIALPPPAVPNLLAGTTTMPWRLFLFYNLTGSVAYAVTYVLIGFFFGKKWKVLEVWLGPTGAT